MNKLGIQKSFDLGDGRIVTIETGKLAKQADGSVVVRMGDTMLLATIVTKKEAAENTDFLPLSVEYQEKYASTGRFPGGFFKREARLSEYEILISRLVDRALRPLFPDDYHAETQVQITLISSDKNDLPDALACLAASSAIAVSNIPFHGPISEVRVARVDNKFIVNPSLSQIENADIDMMVAASMENIIMVEGEMSEISEQEMLEALKVAHNAIKIQCQAQLELAAMVEKANPKREYCHEVNDEDLKKEIFEATYNKAYTCAKSGNKNKHERSESFEAIMNEFLETLPEEERESKLPLVKKYYHDVEKKAMRDMILNDRIRLDGRKLDEIRPIWSEIDYLPAAHG
ncbi:MAG TPA: polyribonucleotide nucleotidyltransferase, partial [Bacteroidales bacterium]|nr:polyribonucleotide nucleotidyltransferase [Bacteroidales bacterium]